MSPTHTAGVSPHLCESQFDASLFESAGELFQLLQVTRLLGVRGHRGHRGHAAHLHTLISLWRVRKGTQRETGA